MNIPGLYVWMYDECDQQNKHVRDWRNIKRFVAKLPRRRLSYWVGEGPDPIIARREKMLREFLLRIADRRCSQSIERSEGFSAN